MMESNDINNTSYIHQATVKTIAFFDLFDYPLTSYEIWKYGLWQGIKAEYKDVLDILKSGKLYNVLEQKSGFYFLASRSEIVKARLARYNYSNRKFKRILLVVRLFKFIPWVKMVAVGNLIGAHNLKDGGDIDVFIVSEAKRIWITRFFCAGFMKLLRLRPKQGDEQDKICLNFYVSERAMDLSGLMLKGDANTRMNANDANREYANKGDIYFIYWLACLVPIYDRDNTYVKLIKANSWLKQCLSNWQPIKSYNRLVADNEESRFYSEVVDLLLGGLEQFVKQIQLKKLPNNLRELMNKDTRVAMNDNVLKLHTKDRREEYQKRWEEKVVQVLKSNDELDSQEILRLASL